MNYDNPDDFRRALLEQIKLEANGDADLEKRLVNEVAYEQLLARLNPVCSEGRTFAITQTGSNPGTLKGAGSRPPPTALLRQITVALCFRVKQRLSTLTTSRHIDIVNTKYRQRPNLPFRLIHRLSQR